MLRELHIRDLAVIEAVAIDLDPGFTTLTGETGAGKSILIDALALVLGARAESGVIRHGCERSEIAAGFELPAQHEAAAWLTQHDLFDDTAIMAADVLTGNDANAARWIRANRDPVAEGEAGGRRVNARRRAPAPGA